MKRSLNNREKRLLLFCVLTLVIVGNVLVIREFMNRQKAATASLSALKNQAATNKLWLKEQDRYAKRRDWIEKSMPFTASEGKSRGELLEDLRYSALDSGLKVENENPQESIALELDNKDVYANEVSVSLRLRGDQDTMLRWLLTLQSTERFTVVKSIELELDSRSKEKTPQALCNLTLARWFNPNPPPGGVPAPAAPPAATPADVPVAPNPLDIPSPLDNPLPLGTS